MVLNRDAYVCEGSKGKKKQSIRPSPMEYLGRFYVMILSNYMLKIKSKEEK